MTVTPQQTRRSFLIAAVVILLVVVFAAVWISTGGHKKQRTGDTLKETAQQFVADPRQFVSNRFTGGIGAALSTDVSGFTKINGVIEGTPAAAGGLQPGDLILEVDGQSTKGMSLVQVVDSIRGFTLASVDLKIQRNGTNLQLSLDRASWQKLREQGNFQYFPHAARPTASSVAMR